MDKEKQIEELANDLKQIKFNMQGCFIPQYVGAHEDITARDLYELGYRKIPEGSIVVDKEDIKRTIEIDTVCEIAFRRFDLEQNARKEALEAFIEELKKKASSYHFGDKIKINNALFIEDINKVAKDFGIKTATRKNKKKQPNFENHTSEPDWN